VDIIGQDFVLVDFDRVGSKMIMSRRQMESGSKGSCDSHITWILQCEVGVLSNSCDGGLEMSKLKF
jgi:hypothetical protein